MSTIDRAALERELSRYLSPDKYNPDGFGVLLAAASAHLESLPKPPRMVEVWRVEFAAVKANTLATWEAASASFPHRALADDYARAVAKWPLTACIKVTGPHLQEVPSP